MPETTPKITNVVRAFRAALQRERAPRHLSRLLRLLVCCSLAMPALAHALSGGDVAITLTSGPKLVSDSNNCAEGDGPHAAYASFQIENTSGGVLNGVQATLNGIAPEPAIMPIPPTAFTFAGGQPATLFLGNLAPGEVRAAYWYIAYPCHASGGGNPPPAQATVDVTVEDDQAGTVTSASSTLTATSSISANAGGSLVSLTLGNNAYVGQVLDMNVTYEFGNVGNSDDFIIQPTGSLNFNAGCFQLLGSNFVSASGFAPGVLPANLNDVMYFFTQNSDSGTGNQLTIQYHILYKCSGVTTTAVPYAAQKSGQDLKYTGNFGGDGAIIIYPAGSNPFTLTKSVDPPSLDVGAGGELTYTVTITNTASVDATLDQITDVLPSGVTYQEIHTTSDIGGNNSTSLPTLGDSGTIVWQGNPLPSADAYTVPAGTSIELVYTVAASDTAPVGSYTNNATGAVGDSDTNTAMATFTINSLANTPPTAVDDSAVTPYDTPVTLAVTTNDSDADGSIDATTVDLAPSTAGIQTTLIVNGQGTFNSDGAGNVTFTPEAGFTGDAAITYNVSDDNGAVSNTATISVHVGAPPGAPPTAADDSADTPHDTPVAIDTLANDQGSALAIDAVTQGANGTVSIDDGGTPGDPSDDQLIYTPNAGFVGQDTFTYTIIDGNGQTDSATVTVTVLNSAPVANDDTAQTPAGAPVDIPLLDNDSDPEGDALSLTLTPVAPPSNSIVALLAAGSATYTPNAGFSGVDTFSYQVCDALGACDDAQVTVAVNAPNAGNLPPAAAADNSQTLQDAPVDITVLTNDIDPEGQPLTVTPPTNSATDQGGLFSVDNNIITYTPPAGFTGSDTFTYEVCDSEGACDTAVVTVTVRPPGSDPAPTAVGDSAATPQNTPVNIDVLSNDTHPNNDILTITAFTDGANGTVALDDGGTPTDPIDDQLIYTPNADVVGQDVFTYTITDANGDTAMASVSVNVTADAGDAPTLFDPPEGVKVINPAGFPELTWRMVWINNSNEAANPVRITDRIPDEATYAPDSVQCEARGDTTVTLCAFDATANQVVYEGSIAPDFGALTEDEADNELIFSFRAAVPSDFFGAIENQAEAQWDADGDGDVDDDITAGQLPVVTDDPTTSNPGDPTATVFPPPLGACLFQFQLVEPEPAESPDANPEGVGDPVEGGFEGAEPRQARQQAALPLSLSTPLDGHVVAGSSVAVAALPGPSAGVTLSAPITVTVANEDAEASPDIVEADGVKVETLTTTAEHIVVNQDGLAVILPADVLGSDVSLAIATVSAAQLLMPLPGQAAAGFYHLSLSNGQTQLDAPVTLRLPYADADQNGFVDGHGIDEGLLTLWRYDTGAEQWRHLDDAWVITEHNVVSASTDQLGLVGLFRAADDRPATLAAPSDDVIAFGATSSAATDGDDSGGWRRLARVAQMPYVAAWDTTAIADGDYRLRVACAQDAAALSAFESATAALSADNGNSSNCFIATAAFGSPLAPQVQVLRDFRDAYLMQSALGRWLVSQYYRFSPPLADVIRRHHGLRTVTRAALTPLIRTARLAQWRHAGLLAAGMLLALTGALGLGYWRWRRSRHNSYNVSSI